MFAPMILGAVAAGVSATASLVHHYRAQLGPMSLREAQLLTRLPVTPVADAPGRGLVRLVGTVGTLSPQSSYYHRLACASLELRHYEIVATVQGPRRQLVRVEHTPVPFWIEDETGRVPIDPVLVRIDHEIEGGDFETTVEEHRLRVGERVAVLGIVDRVAGRMSRPMREAAREPEASLVLREGALVTWRSEPEVRPRLTPPAGGVTLSACSIGLGVLGSILNNL